MVRREMAIAMPRWSERPEARMVEAMYERTKGRVVVGPGMSDEFQVNIGLRQANAHNPLLLTHHQGLLATSVPLVD